MPNDPPKITIGDSVFALCVALVLTTVVLCLVILLVPNLPVFLLFVFFPLVFVVFCLPTQAILQKNKEDQRSAAKRGTWEVH